MRGVKKEIDTKLPKTEKQHIIRQSVLLTNELTVLHIVCVIADTNKLYNYISCTKYKYECNIC